ncbi:MAG TPA: hypothetical protein PL193_01405 [Xanthobacteraceae bacterium]|nr:hypothetical protein [Xanthobacteraceae bacterium]
MRSLFIVFISIVLSAPVLAQTQAPKSREELMLQTQRMALENIQSARCGADRCAPATEEEKKNLPLSLTETSQVFGRGIFSGGAAACGIDWNKRNYEPMMAYWRKQKKTERQLALISVIHGLVMQQILNKFSGAEGCPPEMKQDVESKIDFKP